MTRTYKKLKETENDNDISGSPKYFDLTINGSGRVLSGAYDYLVTSSSYIGREFSNSNTGSIESRASLPNTSSSSSPTIYYNSPLKSSSNVLYVPVWSNTSSPSLGYRYSSDYGSTWTTVTATSGDEGYNLTGTEKIAYTPDIFELDSEIYIVSWIQDTTLTEYKFRIYNATQNFNYSTYGYETSINTYGSRYNNISKGFVYEDEYYFYMSDEISSTQITYTLYKWDGTNDPVEVFDIDTITYTPPAIPYQALFSTYGEDFITKKGNVWFIQPATKLFIKIRDEELTNIYTESGTFGKATPMWYGNNELQYFIIRDTNYNIIYKVYENGYFTKFKNIDRTIISKFGYGYDDTLYLRDWNNAGSYADWNDAWQIDFTNDLDFIDADLSNIYLENDTLAMLMDVDDVFDEGDGIAVYDTAYTTGTDNCIFHGTVMDIDIEQATLYNYKCESNKRFDFKYLVPVSYTDQKASYIISDILDNHCIFLYKGTIQDGAGTPPTYSFKADTDIVTIFTELWKSEGRLFEIEPDGKTNFYSTIQTVNATAYALGDHGPMVGPTENKRLTNAVQIIGGVKADGSLAKLTVRKQSAQDNNISTVYQDHYPRMIDDTAAAGHEMYDLAIRLIEHNEANVNKWQYDVYDYNYLPATGKYHKISDSLEGLTDELLIVTSFNYNLNNKVLENVETYDGLYVNFQYEENQTEANQQRIEQVAHQTVENTDADYLNVTTETSEGSGIYDYKFPKQDIEWSDLETGQKVTEDSNWTTNYASGNIYNVVESFQEHYKPIHIKENSGLNYRHVRRDDYNDSEKWISFWFYPVSGSNDFYIHLYNITSSQDLLSVRYDLSAQGLDIVFYPAGGVSYLDGEIEHDKWHYLAVKYVQNGTTEIYIDGKFVVSGTSPNYAFERIWIVTMANAEHYLDRLYIGDSEVRARELGKSNITAGNLLVTNSLKILNQGICRVTKDDAQAIPNATIQKVYFDDIDFDYCDNFDTSNYRYVASNRGIYYISTQVTFNDYAWTDGEIMALRIHVNGTQVKQTVWEVEASETKKFSLNTNTLVYLEDTNYVEIFCEHYSGGTVYLRPYSVLNIFEIFELVKLGDN